MNWQRIWLMVVYDLRWTVFRRKGLVFLLPFTVFWYLVLRRFYQGIASWIQSSGILDIASAHYDAQTIETMFVTHSPSMSAFFIIAVYTTPFFALLAANDMFAADLGRGYFRFLITRCHRLEIFLARYLASFILTSVAILAVGLIATLIAIYIEDYPLKQTLPYYIQICFILCLYMTPFLALMAIISTIVDSAIAALLLGVASYTAILITIAIASAAYPDVQLFVYLLPSGMKNDLFSHNTTSLAITLLTLPAYTFLFAVLAWTVFRRRNF